MDSRLLWLALAAFVGSTEGGVIAGLLPSIGDEMAVTPGQTGQVVLAYSLAYAIGTPLLSAVLGGVGRRRILAGGEFVLAMGALIIAVAPTFGWVVSGRTLLAVGAGLFTATALATATMIAPPGQRGRALQVVSMGQSLAVLLGVPAGAYVGTHFSWRIDYFVVAGMALAAALALYLRLPKGMPGDQQTLADRLRVLGNRGVVPALLTTTTCMVAAYFPIVFIGPVMTGVGLNHDLLPLPLFANGVGAILASLTAGRIADRFGNKAAVVVACAALIAVLAVFIPLPHLPLPVRPVVLIGTFGLLGYIGWGYWIAHCSEMAHLAPTSVPVAISLNLTALNVGVAVAAMVGGAIVDAWGANAFGFVAVPIAVGALALALVTPARLGEVAA